LSERSRSEVTGPSHTIAVCLVMNKIALETDGDVTFAHLRLVVNKLKEMIDVDVSGIRKILEEGGELELDLGFGEFRFVVDGDEVRVVECPYREKCLELVEALDVHPTLLVAPSTILVQLALDGTDRYVAESEQGEEECVIRLAKAP